MFALSIILLLITALFLIINHKNRFAYAFSLYFISVLALIFFATIYLIKVANYPYTFTFDYKIYLYFLKLRVSYRHLYRCYLLSLCAFMLAPVLFYVLLSRTASLKMLIPLVSMIVLFMVSNDPNISVNLHFYLHTTTGRVNTAVNTLIQVRRILSNCMIYFCMVLPVFLLIRYFLHSKLKENRRNAVIFIICITLMDFLVGGLLLSKYWGSISLNHITLFSLPSESIPLADYPTTVISSTVIIMVIFALVTFYNPLSSYALVKRSVLIRRAQILNQNLDAMLHIYKNAFWGIKNLGEMSLDMLDNDPEKCREALTLLVDTSAHHLDTVQNALSSLRKVTPKIEVLDILDCLSAASAKVSSTVTPQIVMEDATSSTLLLGDFYMLEEVFINLFTNAYQAMQDLARPGEIRAVLATEGEYLIVDCIDNGAGISQDILDEIFSPFFTTKAITSNSGLGLTYVQKVVEAHRGTIEVSSKETVGTRFRLVFPLIRTRKEPKRYA